MIMFQMLVLVLVPLVAAIEALFSRNKNVLWTASLGGLSAGLLGWNAYLYWPAFPAVSIALALVALVLIVRLARLGQDAIKRGAALGIASAAVMFMLWQGVLVTLANVPTVSELETMNEGGQTGRALIVYHAGRTGFQKMLNEAFAEGLVSRGWQVDITTASNQTPTSISGYDLLVLGTPTYDWRPSRRIQEYLKGLGDLGGIRTVIIVSAEGWTAVSQPAMEHLVENANGELVESLTAWMLAPNEAIYGTSDIELAMRQKAASIPLP